MRKPTIKTLVIASLILHSASSIAAPTASTGQGAAATSPALASSGEMLEAVVATVNEVPITLTDVLKRLPTSRKMTLGEASRDTEFKQALDALILEKLIEEEAKSKKVDTSGAEVEEYVNEVAQRNNLDRSAFEAALASEGKSLDDYKRQVRVEILKSKLISASVRGSVSISDSEIENYLKENPESTAQGTTVKLRRIVVKTDGRSESEAEEKINEIRQKVEDGEDFADAAKSYSESPDATEGGLLGTVAEKDLSSEIFDAIFALEAGQISKVVKTQGALNIFKVEEKTSGISEDDDDDDEKLALRRDAARKVLMDRKAQEKMSSFFVHDLYESHSVDKKI